MRQWSGEDYDNLSDPMLDMVKSLFGCLDLRGDETVVDLGRGSGRVTAILAEVIPRGRLIAVDNNQSMLAVAEKQLSGFQNVTLTEQDITNLDLGSVSADVVFSSATFHWIKDHDLLFSLIYELLADGGLLLAQCGGAGNVSKILSAANRVSGQEPFVDYLSFWQDPLNFAGPEETEELLFETGFSQAQCSLVDVAVLPRNPRDYLSQIILGHYLEALPNELEDPFLDEMMVILAEPFVADYVRLNIQARR